MKKILVSILISCSILTTIDAASLVPSLTTQMQHQEKINTKNIYTARLTEIADKKAATRAKILIIKNRKNISVPTITVTDILPMRAITQPATDTYIQPSIGKSPVQDITGVDMSRVRSSWLGWYNEVRRAEGVDTYSYDTRLDSTAHEWNIRFAADRGGNHHRRHPGDSYYDFAVIDAWFIAHGIDPVAVNGAKHTENVGYGYYACSSGDCTGRLIQSIRTTFDFFMREKGQAYDAHYRSIVQPNFSKIGLDIIVVPGEQRYYLTVHYITD